MTSNIAGHALRARGALPHNPAMPRSARPNPKPRRRPTFIRSWRKLRGLTLLQLSDRLETLHSIQISDGQLSRIERGESPYGQDLLEAIADVLRCDVPDLLVRDPSRSDGIWSVWDTVRQMTPQQTTQLVEMAKVLKRTETG